MTEPTIPLPPRRVRPCAGTRKRTTVGGQGPLGPDRTARPIRRPHRHQRALLRKRDYDMGRQYGRELGSTSYVATLPAMFPGLRRAGGRPPDPSSPARRSGRPVMTVRPSSTLITGGRLTVCLVLSLARVSARKRVDIRPETNVETTTRRHCEGRRRP